MILSRHIRQYELGRTGSEVRQALLSGQMSIDQGWDKLFELRKSVWVPFLLHGLQETLEGKLLDEGSEPIIDYRQDQPTASLTDWQRAEGDFRRLMQLDPRNRVVKGRELLCEGQNRPLPLWATRYVHGRVLLNAKLLSQAITDFQRAAELMPDSPDPYLAMSAATGISTTSRIMRRGAWLCRRAAVKSAGHITGKRETAQMADTLKANAKRDMALAQQFEDSPERRKQHLESAVSYFESSIQSYEQIAGFGGSNQGLKEALQGRQQAQRLLDQIDGRLP